MDVVAVLSDIHGNLPALEAVLTDVAMLRPDLVVVNGDLADGPFPSQTLELLDTLGDRAIWIGGNGDRAIVESVAGTFSHRDRRTKDVVEWSARRISETHLKRLAALPLVREINVSSIGRVGFRHATARADDEAFLVDSSFDQARAAFAELRSDVVVLGHSHMPFDRLFDRIRIVNAGSVGMPYGHTGAAWARLGPDIVLRRTSYDTDTACDRILRSGMPGAAAFADTYVRNIASDREAVAVFAAIRRDQEAARHGRSPQSNT